MAEHDVKKVRDSLLSYLDREYWWHDGSFRFIFARIFGILSDKKTKTWQRISSKADTTNSSVFLDADEEKLLRINN